MEALTQAEQGQAFAACWNERAKLVRRTNRNSAQDISGDGSIKERTKMLDDVINKLRPFVAGK